MDMFFIHYRDSEVKIFNGVKAYFEKLPANGLDDYPNGFYDIVAQYSGEGQEYILAGSMFRELIENTIEEEYKKLPKNEKEEIQKLYESNFLNPYNFEDFSFTEDELYTEMFQRFKAWIDDNFNLDDLMEDE